MGWFILGLVLGFLIAFELGGAIYNKKMDEIQGIAKDMEKDLAGVVGSRNPTHNEGSNKLGEEEV